MIKDWGSPANPGCLVNDVPTLKCFEVLFNNILVISGGLFVLALFIMFVLGAFTYLSSFGNPEKVKKAQAIFRYAIYGLVLFLASYLILNIIDILFLGGAGKIFQFKVGE